MSETMWRYFKLLGARDGEWPADNPMQPGNIVRINVTKTPLPGGMVWNDSTHDWVEAHWVEVENPALAATASSDTSTDRSA